MKALRAGAKVAPVVPQLAPKALKALKPAPPARKIAIARELAYIWHSARCFFIMPVTMEDNGVMRFSWHSWWARYTVVAWVLFVPCMAKTSWTIYSRQVDR